jgi:phospholipase/carboxylesterase
VEHDTSDEEVRELLERMGRAADSLATSAPAR